ncbi:hypothetical protein EBB07_28005 [Paenibacillaceae bacterium]|nr:hypothetical protein EBB07_28005 [Paenibacillaceae bacterium]
MTLYTSMPLEAVLDGVNNDREPAVEIHYGSVLLSVEPVAPGIGRVVRVLQGSLEDYLRPELTPGTMLTYGKKS